MTDEDSGDGWSDDKMSDDTLFQSIRGLAEGVQSLNQQAVREYTPIVEDILRSRSRDARQIEHTLDGLLDFCGYGPALVLYRKLCRHYWEIDPAAAASYVKAYREMWESEELGKNQGTTAAPEAGQP